MKGFWMMMVFGFATGCPDGDDDSDAACPLPCGPGYVCLYGDCVPEGSDADGGDADATDDGTTETEDDATEDGTDEGTASCPWVAGTWEITFEGVFRYTFLIGQTDCTLTAERDDMIYGGNISEDGALSLTWEDGPSRYETLTGNLVSPNRMTGNYSRGDGASGTWEADLQ